MHSSLPARLGLTCSLAALLAFGGTAASAQEGVAFKNIMGTIGIIPAEKDPIRYRERAPLVLPPKADLPQPAQSYASSNPQWPSDPDVVAKRRRDEDSRNPVTWSETRRMSENNPRLSPQELARGRSANSSAPIPGTHRGDNARDVLLLNPDQLGPKSRSDVDDEKLAAGQEPKRRTLADPPGGYRKSLAGAKAAGLTPKIDQQALDANPMTWLTRKFNGSEDDE